MKIHIENNQIDLSFDKKNIIKIVKTFLAFYKIKADEAAIYFVTEEEICKLHEDFFSDPSPTDCISFPLDSEDEPYRILGEIFVCPQTAVQYAKNNHTNSLEELYLYVVHGLLHLIGFDDIEESDRLIMRAKEKEFMGYLKNNLPNIF
ncbi:Endoribonuclease YbeY [Candidatus Rubidus massiliensis]|nr:Endoribonuclease YbeY [Candidatus Rubidus massiliensis]